MPAGTKRKTTANNGGSAPKKSKMSKAALREFELQYYQGVSILELHGCGCGNYLLGSPLLDFHSPIDGPMWFEIMSGLKGPGSGCIRLCVPGKDAQDVLAPRFVVPMRHIEQVIIIDEPIVENSPVSKEQAYRVIIVPTGAVGASPLKRTYPQVIQFKLPDQKAGKDFKGQIGEANDDPDETYLSLITRVLNEQLAPYQKAVTDASSTSATQESDATADATVVCGAVFRNNKGQNDTFVKGQLFFLQSGILFHSETTILYLTAESTPSAMLISNCEVKSKQPEPRNLTLICQLKGEDSMFISFQGIDRDMSNKITSYAKKRGISLRELEQEWYSIEKDQPATGWQQPGEFLENWKGFTAKRKGAR